MPATGSTSSSGSGPPTAIHETRAWIRRKRKPVSQERGVNTVGLLEACEEIAAVVQEELHTLPSPLTMDQAVELWQLPAWLPERADPPRLGGHRLAKEVEAKVAPNGQPLAICLGSNRRHQVETVRGPMTMQGYCGCLRTFPDLPFGRGNGGLACARSASLDDPTTRTRRSPSYSAGSPGRWPSRRSPGRQPSACASSRRGSGFAPMLGGEKRAHIDIEAGDESPVRPSYTSGIVALTVIGVTGGVAYAAI